MLLCDQGFQLLRSLRQSRTIPQMKMSPPLVLGRGKRLPLHDGAQKRYADI